MIFGWVFYCFYRRSNFIHQTTFLSAWQHFWPVAQNNLQWTLRLLVLLYIPLCAYQVTFDVEVQSNDGEAAAVDLTLVSALMLEAGWGDGVEPVHSCGHLFKLLQLLGFNLMEQLPTVFAYCKLEFMWLRFRIIKTTTKIWNCVFHWISCSWDWEDLDNHLDNNLKMYKS